jgi:hypothetical protein
VRLDAVAADPDDLDPFGSVVLGERDESVLQQDDEGAVVASGKEEGEEEEGRKK